MATACKRAARARGTRRRPDERDGAVEVATVLRRVRRCPWRLTSCVVCSSLRGKPENCHCSRGSRVDAGIRAFHGQIGMSPPDGGSASIYRVLVWSFIGDQSAARCAHPNAPRAPPLTRATCPRPSCSVATILDTYYHTKPDTPQGTTGVEHPRLVSSCAPYYAQHNLTRHSPGRLAPV